MALSTGTIRRRIRGIGNTKKITKAMELVAASKMRRAVRDALGTRSYALLAWNLLTNVSGATDPALHPLLARRSCHKAMLVIFSSDRGLAGGLNANIVRLLVNVVSHYNPIPVDVVAFGKKAVDAARRQGYSVLAAFAQPYREPRLADILPLTNIVLEAFRSGTHDRVEVLWTDYQSAIVQKAHRRTLLPIGTKELAETMHEVGAVPEPVVPEHDAVREYLFEPSAGRVLDALLVRLVEMQLYQLLLEATASEHAARMMAMRNATEAASDLIDDLTLEFNRMRQSAITKDLAEISASRAALEA